VPQSKVALERNARVPRKHKLIELASAMLRREPTITHTSEYVRFHLQAKATFCTPRELPVPAYYRPRRQEEKSVV